MYYVHKESYFLFVAQLDTCFGLPVFLNYPFTGLSK